MRLASATAISLLTVLASAPLLAQAAVPAPPPSNGNDIVVTAQRREQRLQDVGIAITAITAQQLQQQNVTSSVDIVRLVPSLKYNAFSSSAVVFNIRGISQNDYGDQQEPPVAVYQDDSYASTITLAGFPVFDTARVEVLRGPQGTLFGRNATGGAIQFISEQPKKTPGGYVKTTVGSYGALTLEGAATTPLTDTLSVRLAGQRNTGGNYMKAIEPGVPDVGGLNDFALRGIVKWAPWDGFTSRLILRYLKANHERQAGLYSHVVACPNAHLQGEYLAPDATCAYWVGIATPGPGTTATGFRDDAINPERGGDPWKTAYTYPSFVNRKLFGANYRFDVDLGGVDLTSITDYQHATKLYSEDFDGTPAQVGNYVTSMRLNQMSEELRLSGKAGKNSWVVGTYGMYIKGDYTATFFQPDFDYFPFAAFKQKTKSYAFFAQDEYAISSKIKLIGGLRYWHDERIGSYAASEAGSGVSVQFAKTGIAYQQNGVPQPLSGLTVSPNDADKSFSGLTARAEIDYKPANSVLLYVSYNRGTKSGGFTFPSATPFPAGVVNFLNNIPYKPETLNSYEAGMKASIGTNMTFNVALFHYDYKNYQAFAQIGLIQSILNLNAKENGVEAEYSWRPFRGLSLSASASYLDSKLKNVPIQDGTLVTGHLPEAPAFSGNASARYAFAFGPGEASIQGDVQYTGKSCYTTICSPVDREPAYTVLNGRVGYDISRFQFAVFVNNITNEQYRLYAVDNALTAGFDDSIYAKPRTFGVSATVHFGD